MASDAKKESHGNRLFVLALGLLVGFVIGFVVLLSRLPMDLNLGDYGANEVSAEMTGRYQFYNLLPSETERQAPPSAGEALPQARPITPATRVVPGSVQSLSARSLAAESYAEIPANSIGQESYYLQVGNYRRADEAEQSRAALLLHGLEAFVVVRHDVNGVAGHRVRIGPFFEQARINTAKERLKRKGINYKLIRVTG
ncbi:MAG: hypothetical protein HKN42_16650 [Granulosicoccus sp.]|nr:hypothetical protein [Granulosicoccus sp.]